jgi:hypothetical protein
LIAQDKAEIFVGINTYNDAYLNYLFRPAPVVILPLDTQVIPILEIQEFGPFKIRKGRHLGLLAHIILSLLISELEGLKAGALIITALETMATECDNNDDDNNDDDDDG